MINKEESFITEYIAWYNALPDNRKFYRLDGEVYDAIMLDDTEFEDRNYMGEKEGYLIFFGNFDNDIPSPKTLFEENDNRNGSATLDNDETTSLMAIKISLSCGTICVGGNALENQKAGRGGVIYMEMLIDEFIKFYSNKYRLSIRRTSFIPPYISRNREYNKIIQYRYECPLGNNILIGTFKRRKKKGE